MPRTTMTSTRAVRAGTHWRQRLAAACALLGGALLAAPAQAGDPTVHITVTPIPSTVSLRVLNSTTQAAYRVQIVNASTNVLNAVHFEAQTRIDPAATPAATKFVEANIDPGSTAQCALAAGSQTRVACDFGQLRGGGVDATSPSGASFVVVFEAPTSGSKLYLDWTAYYREGSTDNNGNSSPTNDSQSSAEPGKAVFTTLVTGAQVNDRQLRSYFAKSTGALLFTGVGVPLSPPSTDQWTTAVRIPPGTAGQARIVEDSDPNSCSPVIPSCVRSAVSVPGTYLDTTPLDANPTFLVFTLRRDASTIPAKASITDAPVLYEPGTIDDQGVFQPTYPGNPDFPVRLKLCSAIGGAPSEPAAGTPPALAEQQLHCIYSRQAYPKNYKAAPDLAGDWEWVIWAVKNGRISF